MDTRHMPRWNARELAGALQEQATISDPLDGKLNKVEQELSTRTSRCCGEEQDLVER